MEQASTQLAVNRAASRVLGWGFTISAVLVVVGLALTAVRGDSLHTSLESLPDMLDELADGRGAGVVGLGILAMIVTPIVSTIAIIVACVRIGDRRYAMITSAVLVILAISAILSAL
jgi:uncharacterized membrane protein